MLVVLSLLAITFDFLQLTGIFEFGEGAGHLPLFMSMFVWTEALHVRKVKDQGSGAKSNGNGVLTCLASIQLRVSPSVHFFQHFLPCCPCLPMHQEIADQ